jgi:hypothetical protein
VNIILLKDLTVNFNIVPSAHNHLYAEGTMLLLFIKYSYRVLATLVVALPITLNVIYPSSIVSSLIYIPLLSLALAVIFIYVEKQLQLNSLVIKKRLKDNNNNRPSSINKRYLNKLVIGNNLSKQFFRPQL